MSISEAEEQETYRDKQPPFRRAAEKVMSLGESLAPVKIGNAGNI